MDKLLFGISGLPIGKEGNKFTYSTGITYLKQIGLDAMELPFVRSVNVTEKNKDAILTSKHAASFYLSAHGSYYVNLNAVDELKKQQSLERIIKGAEALKKVQGKSLVFHPGYYLKSSKEETFSSIKQCLLTLPDLGIDYRLETTGKRTQFGSLEEIVQICSEVKTCKPCIDFSHLHARENGCLKTYDDFAKILEHIKSKLGDDALTDMHVHISGINYGEKGEKNHLPFEESDFNYKDCMRAFKDYKVKGCIVCESPLLEYDCLLLKSFYDNL
jgi:deoxyribonuclease-4